MDIFERYQRIFNPDNPLEREMTAKKKPLVYGPGYGESAANPLTAIASPRKAA